jgi:hypothetical protein
MTVPTIKVKVVRRPQIKVKAFVKFPSAVTVTSPILLSTAGGNYAFSFDTSALITSLNLLYDLLADVVQTVTTASDTIGPNTTLLVIQRAAPALTQLALPALGTSRLRILDWSTAVTDHEIRLTPNGTNTIMKAATYSAFSNAAQLASLTLHPSATLNGWYIAP